MIRTYTVTHYYASESYANHEANRVKQAVIKTLPWTKEMYDKYPQLTTQLYNSFYYASSIQAGKKESDEHDGMEIISWFLGILCPLLLGGIFGDILGDMGGVIVGLIALAIGGLIVWSMVKMKERNKEKEKEEYIKWLKEKNNK